MNNKKSPFTPAALLWWVAIISIGISVALFFSLAEQSKFDPELNQRRMFIPVIGFIIAGVCAIAGTAGRWFYPK